MKKREHYQLNRLLLRQIKTNKLRIESNKTIEELVISTLRLKPRDIKHNGWYHKGFVFIRFLNDYVEIKTIDEFSNSKSINLSLSEDSIKSYINYLNKLME